MSIIPSYCRIKSYSCNQPTMKRTSSQVYCLQNEETMSNVCQEDEIKAKRSKHEMNPLKMGGVLEKVFLFLDVKTIKEVRLVSKLWSAEGAKMLFTRCYASIPKDIRVGKFVSGLKKVDELKAFLSHKLTDISMIPSINIDNQDDFELWDYLGALGPQVSSLKLNFKGIEVESFRNLLDLLPNLKYLTFGDLQLCNQQNEIFNALTSAMSKEEKNGNPLLLSKINVQPLNMKELEEIEAFSACRNIKIEQLFVGLFPDNNFTNVPQLEARFAECVNKLLSSSQNTLKTLNLEHDVPLLRLDFPKMASLISFSCAFSETLRNCKFSPKFRFSEMVPNLQDFTLTLETDETSNLDGLIDLFENTGPAASVKHLEFQATDFLDFNIDPLVSTFSNIETFKASRFESVQTMLGSLWKHAKNLKKLDLEICLDEITWDAADLDSAFTGFTPKTTKWIKSAPEGVIEAVNIYMLRVNPSILNLKELEHITIKIDGNCRDFLPERMLVVAEEFALKLMKKVPELSIHVTDCKRGIRHAWDALDEVSKLPNVTVQFDIDYSVEDEDDDDPDDEGGSEG